MEDIKCDDPELQEMFDETREIHTLWHALHDYLESHDKNIDHLAGYDDMKLMDKFCDDHPDVIRVHVDDAHHCNSYLYIVPHESEKKYMGATVIVVPQCCGTNNQFFLYPNDNRGLLKACRILEKKFQEKPNELFRDLYGDFDEDEQNLENKRER